jgi:hypothetical protein
MTSYPRRASSDSRIDVALRHITVNPYGRVLESGRRSPGGTPRHDAGGPLGVDGGGLPPKVMHDLQAKLEARNMEIDNLRREMRQKEEMTQQRMELAIGQHEAQSQAQVMEAEEEAEKLRRYVARLESQKRDAERAGRSRIAELEDEVKRLGDKAAKADQLRAELAQGHGADRRIKRLNSRLELLEPVKEELEKENDRLRAQLLAIPLLEEQILQFQARAEAAEFAANELQLAATMQENEVAQLRLQLQSSANALDEVGLERRRPTPTGRAAQPSSLDDALRVSPMASPSGSFMMEPSLGDQMMEFLDLTSNNTSLMTDGDRSGSPDRSDDADSLQLQLADKDEQLDEKMRIIDHLEQTQFSMVSASHRMQREVSQLKQQLQKAQAQAEANAAAAAAAAASAPSLTVARPPSPAPSPSPSLPASVGSSRAASPPPAAYHAVALELVAAAREAAKDEGSIVTYPSLRESVESRLKRDLEAIEKVYVRGFAEAAAASDTRKLAELLRANAHLRADLDEAARKIAAAGTTKLLGSAPVLVDGNLLVPDGAAVDGYHGSSTVKRVTMGCDVTVSAYSFIGCTELESVVCGAGCTLGESNFADCKTLASVTAGERLSVQDNAFQGCDLLQSVSLGPAAQLGRGLPDRFYQAAAGKTISGSSSGGGGGDGDLSAIADGDLAARIASLTREVDFLTQGMRVKDAMLSDIQRDARAALMPALSRELELAKLMSARLRWQTALLTSRCKSLKAALAEADTRVTALAADNTEMKSELAKALVVIQSCPVGKILERQREKKRLKKEKEQAKKLARRAARSRTKTATAAVTAGASAGAGAAAPSPVTTALAATVATDAPENDHHVTSVALDGGAMVAQQQQQQNDPDCDCGRPHQGKATDEDEGDQDESTESKTATKEGAPTVSPPSSSTSSTPTTGTSATMPTTHLAKDLATLDGLQAEKSSSKLLLQASQRTPSGRAGKRDRFVELMRAATDKMVFSEYFAAAFDCVESKVRMRGKSSYGYEYSYEGEANAAGKPHGIGRAQFDKQKHGVYIGEFVDGLFHGRGTRAQPHGCYTGSWERGKLHGQGTLWKADGTEGFSGQWEDSKPVLPALRPTVAV